MHPLIEKHRQAMLDLCARYKVRRLEIFGSAARGEDDARSSDLDFLVEFEDLPPVPYGDCYFGLLFGLEKLFKRKIDLVTLRSITNPYFLQEIEPDRSVVYEQAGA